MERTTETREQRMDRLVATGKFQPEDFEPEDYCSASEPLRNAIAALNLTVEHLEEEVGDDVCMCEQCHNARWTLPALQVILGVLDGTIIHEAAGPARQRAAVIGAEVARRVADNPFYVTK